MEKGWERRGGRDYSFKPYFSTCVFPRGEEGGSGGGGDKRGRKHTVWVIYSKGNSSDLFEPRYEPGVTVRKVKSAAPPPPPPAFNASRWIFFFLPGFRHHLIAALLKARVEA